MTWGYLILKIFTAGFLFLVSNGFHTSLLSLHPSSQVQIEDVENEGKRYALFLGLLEAAQKWEDFQLLILLLQAWPPMMKEEV